ncbi:hypothetical protein B0H17DRAFT_1083476 [Mycena rosella]|uniref:Chromatin target of PRMT1 protein C-terminal domain-containing protein n=1 Tax=Mycena rosella TaxID=1033263 RepID=A0AAD7D0Z8_MYCRO|nr:hypothetical protein B0H17DRAFT_1083476 [Mycena rosella]
MDTFPDVPDAYPDALSYDDTAYEAQLPTPAEQASLANRIGTTKVYLLSETIARVGKRKYGDEDGLNDAEFEMDEDISYRGNALLLQGSPISNLPTAGLFAYATHFDAHPLGLEWVDDERCVFVFESKTDARTAYKFLQKHITEEPDADGYITAKPIPVAIWPPEERINSSLGKGQGLKGTIRMRWAKNDDVKKRGAKKDSQFYKKHGWTAGKETVDDGSAPTPPKRRRRGSNGQDEIERAALDAELDEFIRAEDELTPEPDLDGPSSPQSKMRSDYISTDGRTLLERTSVMRAQPGSDSLASRLTAPLPRRTKVPRGTMYADSLENPQREDRLEWGRDEGAQWGREARSREPRINERSSGPRRDTGRRNGRDGKGGERRGRNERPVMTHEDLDAELDAFLEAKD